MSDKQDTRRALFKKLCNEEQLLLLEKRKAAGHRLRGITRGKKRATAEEKAEIEAYLANNRNPKYYNEV